MWIIPKQLHALSGAPDTEAFLSDLNEQSQACAQSLLARSKPSPARTWSQKWKRDSWTQHLFGRILKPSHAKPFETAWTSLWQDILANPSAQPENDSEQKTHATSGHTSWEQSELFAPESVSLKMSKDTFRWDSPQSSAIWKNWVTKCRGEYSQRLKSGHLTKGKECSSWPTVTANEDSYRIGGESKQSKCLSAMARRGEMTQWPTPQAQDTQRTPEAYAAAKEKRGGKMFLSLNIVAQLHGQAAPASSSTGGSRQGLWQTATVSTGAHRQKDGSMINKLDQQVKQWATPQASDPEHSEPNQRDSSGRPALPAQAANKMGGKLNPRWVETLMGLPVGWVMPSCKSPVTIAPTNSDCLATELCQQQQNELFEP